MFYEKELQFLCDVYRKHHLCAEVVPLSDFAAYLKTAFGIRIKLVGEKGDVAARIDPDALTQCKGYMGRKTTVTAKGVEIAAFDERGIAQAFYALEDRMNIRKAPFLEQGATEQMPAFSPRMIHSGVGLDYYPDEFDPRFGTSPRVLMERNFQSIRRYALTFGPGADNLLFVGGTGLGKTYLAACVARVVADRGFSVCYETSAHLFSKLEQARFSPTEDSRREAAKLQECDLLIIDDLGTEMPGQFVTSALYSLLNDRLLSGKPMLITTNLSSEEMARRYSPQIASRIYGSFSGKTFVGQDIRVLKNRSF